MVGGRRLRAERSSWPVHLTASLQPPPRTAPEPSFDRSARHAATPDSDGSPGSVVTQTFVVPSVCPVGLDRHSRPSSSSSSTFSSWPACRAPRAAGLAGPSSAATGTSDDDRQGERGRRGERSPFRTGAKVCSSREFLLELETSRSQTSPDGPSASTRFADLHVTSRILRRRVSRETGPSNDRSLGRWVSWKGATALRFQEPLYA